MPRRGKKEEQSTQEPKARASSRRRAPRVLLALLSGFLAGLCVWAGVWGTVLFLDARALIQSRADVSSALAARDVARVEVVLPELRRKLEHLRRDLYALGVVTWIPGLRGERESAMLLTTKGEFLLDAATLGASILREIHGPSRTIASYAEVQPEDLRRVQGILAASAPQVQGLAARGGDLLARPTETSRLQLLITAHADVDRFLRTVQWGGALLQNSGAELFQLLAVGGERRYLLLFQNAEEIRPGGGLISTYGTLTVRDGQVMNLTITHVERDRFKDPAKYPPAPEPIRRLVWPYLAIPDINWDPDPSQWLPDAYALWNATEGTPVQGIIVLGTPLLKDLVSFYRPLELPGYPGEYTGENIVAAVDAVTTTEAQRQGGAQEAFDILRVLVSTLLERVRATPIERWSSLGSLLSTRAAARDVLVYVPDPAEQAFLQSLGVRIALLPRTGDEFFLVDANLGSGKADGEMRRSLTLDVDLQDLDHPRARATIAYDYRDGERDSRTWPYRGYLRLLVPPGATLTRFDGGQGPPEVSEEGSRTVFANYIYVNFGEVQDVVVEYDLPERVRAQLDAGIYALSLPKQGGVELPFIVTVLPPSSWSSVNGRVSLGSLSQGGERAANAEIWTGTLDKDATLTLSTVQ